MRWRIAPLVLSLAASPLLAQVPMGPEFVVSTGTTTPGGSVRAAAAPDGRFAIVWSDRSRDGSGFGVFGRVFAANGQPVGEDFQVNTYTTGDQSLWFELPSVSFGGNGFVVVWGSDEQDGEWWGVFGQRFGPDGMRLGAEFQVNTQTGANQQSPSVAMAPDGRFTVVWMADPPGSSFRIFGQRYDAAGNPSGGEFVVATSANTFEPAIAMDGVGNSVVVWETGSCAGVFGQRFDAAGDRRGAEFQVTSGTSACPNGAGVAMSPDGRFVVSWGAWTQGTELDLRAQLFDASGNRVGGELLVNTYTTWSQGRHAVAMDGNGRFVLAWDPGNGGCAHARRYDAGGQPATPEFAVNPHFTLSGHGQEPRQTRSATSSSPGPTPRCPREQP